MYGAPCTQKYFWMWFCVQYLVENPLNYFILRSFLWLNYLIKI